MRGYVQSLGFNAKTQRRGGLKGRLGMVATENPALERLDSMIRKLDILIAMIVGQTLSSAGLIGFLLLRG